MSDFTAVRRKLQRDRAMDEQGVTRSIRARHCGRCRLVVLAAIDDLGFTVACWPTPTTHRGELQALLAGRRTFYRFGTELESRNSWNIAGKSPDIYDVLVEHHCADSPPEKNPRRELIGFGRSKNARAIRAWNSEPGDDEPPY